jgi:hypothetical protein
MPREPDWSRSIQSSTVCTWFYILAIVNGVFAVVGVLAALYLVSLGKRSMMTVIPMLLAGGIGFTNAWFLFLVCNRGLGTEGFYGRFSRFGKGAANIAFSAATGGGQLFY